MLSLIWVYLGLQKSVFLPQGFFCTLLVSWGPWVVALSLESLKTGCDKELRNFLEVAESGPDDRT